MVSKCPAPTLSGYATVEIVGGFCEVGEGCEVTCCPHAWKKSDRKTSAKADRAFAQFIQELEGKL